MNSRGEPPVDMEGAIPAAVDAHDGFDAQEKGSEARVEEDLVNTVNNWQLCPNTGGRSTDAMPGTPNFVEGGASGGAVLEVTPLAMKFMEDTARVLVGERQASSGPHSSDMIPVLRGLSNLHDSDVSMSDSVLGKRTAEENEVQGEKLDLSLALDYGVAVGGQPKKGKTGGAAKSQPKEKTTKDVEDAAQGTPTTRTRRKIATGHAATSNLTRSMVWSRQAK
jgi:hypothetical protein